MEKTCIIWIDLQLEFLTRDGFMGEKHIDGEPLIEKVRHLTNLARQFHFPIVWVKACYNHQVKPEPKKNLNINIPKTIAHVPLISDFHASTHFNGPKSRQCCVRGSKLIEFHPSIQEIIEPNDIVITKNWYSAFTETGLAKKLNKKGIKRLYIGGVSTHVCVQATCIDAFFLGYKVNIFSDATNSSKKESYEKGLTEMSKYYAKILTTEEAIEEWKNVKYGSGDCRLLHDIFEPKLINFEEIKKEISWNEMFHRGGPVPRLVSLQGDLIKNQDDEEVYQFPIYRHPVDEHPILTYWTPIVQLIRDHIQTIVGHTLNHCLIQYYRNGGDHISDHSDKTLDIVPGSFIVNFSIGCTRELMLKSKIAVDGKKEKQHVYMYHNSMFLMGLKTNAEFYHCIQEDNRDNRLKTLDEVSFNGERISFTFRWIGTWIKTVGQDQFIYGQGAKAKTSDQAEPLLYDKSEYSNLIFAFGNENTLSSFNWDEYYGKGFDVIGGKRLSH